MLPYSCANCFMHRRFAASFFDNFYLPGIGKVLDFRTNKGFILIHSTMIRDEVIRAFAHIVKP